MESGANDPANLLKNLGFTIPTLTAAPVTLNALEINNIYGTSGTVISLLQYHYTSNIKSNLLKLLGSSDLIGNPTDFVSTMGTGMKSFYYEPKQGFMKGPIEGGIGLIKGTGALLGHTAGGLAGSVSKITNSLNRGFLHLTFDQEYRHKKEIRDVTEKPKGVVDGVGKGIKGFGISLFDGVTGIVTQPFKGAKEEGGAGFAKGIGKGITGLVVKPISGVVDVISKTTEGIEVSVEGVDCEQNNERYRIARAFYKNAMMITEFNFLHAAVYRELRRTLSERNRAFAN